MFGFPLKYNTASQEVPLGKFVDSTDGDTEETGLTIANTDIKLHKAGATSLVNKNSGGATHMANGEYYAVLDATDTNTLGPMEVTVHVAGALTVKKLCVVLPANVYEAFIAGTALVDVNVSQVFGTSAEYFGATVGNESMWSGLTSLGQLAEGTGHVTPADDSITAAKIATGAIDADALATDAAQEVATALLDLANGVETGVTLRQGLRAIAAALAGKVTNAGTASEAFAAIGNDATTRITTTGDVSGNRDPVLNL